MSLRDKFEFVAAGDLIREKEAHFGKAKYKPPNSEITTHLPYASILYEIGAFSPQKEDIISRLC